MLNACNLFRPAAERDVLVIEPREEITEPDPDEPPIAEDTIVEDRRAQIGLLLPFFLDSIQEIWYLDKNLEEVPQQSVMGLDFYMGALIAIDSLAASDVKMDVHVWDSGNDHRKVIRGFDRRDFDHLDLMIGPIFNQPMRTAAQRNQSKELYLVSPLSPADNIAQNNPYFIQVNPTIEAHCNIIFDYFVFHNRHQNNIVLYTEFEKNSYPVKRIKELKAEYEEKNPYGIFKMQFVMVDSKNIQNASLDTLMVPYTANNFIIPSLNIAHINNFARQLNQHTENYQINVFGLPPWAEYRQIRMDYLHNLNVHYTSSYYIDKKSEGYIRFARQFYDRYKKLPSDNAIKGFDVMMYFGLMLNKYGKDFSYFMENHVYKGLHTQFYFTPQFIDQEKTEDEKKLPESPVDELTDKIAEKYPKQEIDFFQNRYLHLLKYEDFSLKRIN